MPPIGANARLLSNDVLAKWLLEDFPFRIQLASVFPFVAVEGDRLRYATTGPLVPGTTLAHGEIPEDTKEPQEPNRAYRFAEIATHFRVHYAAQDVFSSNVNDQVAVQSALAVRELLYRFWILFESGDSSADPTEFDGLLKLVDPANVVDLGGRELTLEDLDQAKERVRSNDGRAITTFTSSVGKRAIDAAHWVRGLSPSYEAHAFSTPDDEVKELRVLHFDGAPVFVNDLNQVFRMTQRGPGKALNPVEALKADGRHPPLATNIWFFVLGEGNLHGIVPENAQDILVRSTILADASTLVYHHTMPAGIALGNAGALAVVKNATIPTGS